MIHIVTEAKQTPPAETSIYSLGILECRIEFFSRCPYALSRVSPRLSASPFIFLASSSIRFSCWHDKTQPVFRSRTARVDIPKTQRFKLSSHGRCLRVSAIHFAGALYLPAPVVTSRIMSTAKHVHRAPLDGGRCTEGKESQEKQGRSTRRR